MAATEVAEAPSRSGSRGGRPGSGLLLAGLGVVGELLITFGVLVLLFAVYELKVTDFRAASTQHRLASQLAQSFRAPGGATEATPRRDRAGNLPVGAVPTVRDGAGFAELRIPRFGAGYSRVVVEGVSTADLEEGPGHYPGTALPGQIGNVVISGHRTTYGHPFWDADSLRAGDPIYLTLQDRTYRYRVTGSTAVDPSDVGVTDPVPNQPGVRPTHRLLTLTTCTPRFSAAQRLIISAVLAPDGVLLPSAAVAG